MIGTVLLTLMNLNATMIKNVFYTITNTISYECRYGREITDIPEGLEDLWGDSDEENENSD